MQPFLSVSVRRSPTGCPWLPQPGHTMSLRNLKIRTKEKTPMNNSGLLGGVSMSTSWDYAGGVSPTDQRTNTAADGVVEDDEVRELLHAGGIGLESFSTAENERPEGLLEKSIGYDSLSISTPYANPSRWPTSLCLCSEHYLSGRIGAYGSAGARAGRAAADLQGCGGAPGAVHQCCRCLHCDRRPRNPPIDDLDQIGFSSSCRSHTGGSARFAEGRGGRGRTL